MLTCCEAGLKLNPLLPGVTVSQSLPTPNTQEWLRVVTRDALGARGFSVPAPVAPIARDPFVRDVSTPVKLATVIEAATLCDVVALTVTLYSLLGAKARQM